MHTATLPSWLRPEALEPVARINEQALALLRQTAANPAYSRLALVPPTGLRERFITLSADDQARLAREPFLLVDLHFADAQWWREALQHSDVQRKTRLKAARGLRTAMLSLSNAAVTVAWYYARAEAHSAPVVLGLTSAVARELRTASPIEVQRTAQLHAQELSLRWADQPSLWQRLLLPGGGSPACTRWARIQILQQLAPPTAFIR